MNDLAPRTLTPPRSNLGPEPWPDTEPALAPWILLATTLLVVAVGVWVRRRRSARAGSISSVLQSGAQSHVHLLFDLALAVRTALASRLGPAWRARTTEEIARDQALRESLGGETFSRLVEFLDQVDTLKFAAGEPSCDEGWLAVEFERWRGWAAELEKSLASSPGAKRKSTSHDRTSVNGASAGHSASAGRASGAGRRST